MPAPLSLPVLTTTLHRHWAESFTPDVPTHFPGVPTPIGQQAAWVELWLDALNAPPQRTAGPPRMEVLITVHCFSRDRHNKILAQQLAEATISALAQRTLAILEHSTDADPETLGWITIQEPQVRDLTRSEDSIQLPPQHLVVSFHGVAQSC